MFSSDAKIFSSFFEESWKTACLRSLLQIELCHKQSQTDFCSRGKRRRERKIPFGGVEIEYAIVSLSRILPWLKGAPRYTNDGHACETGLKESGVIRSGAYFKFNLLVLKFFKGYIFISSLKNSFLARYL